MEIHIGILFSQLLYLLGMCCTYKSFYYISSYPFLTMQAHCYQVNDISPRPECDTINVFYTQSESTKAKTFYLCDNTANI